jgi:hypothetical protein
LGQRDVDYIQADDPLATLKQWVVKIGKKIEESDPILTKTEQN